mmetsp:Transcript_2861/g.4653  ORF Transcript_2861/g.4653 Transcript_2861/m.4653 type:complete len:89 (-) Transcript_2861:29-295(-)
MARNGAMALISDEEVLEEAMMVWARQEHSKLEAKSSEDSGRGGGGDAAVAAAMRPWRRRRPWRQPAVLWQRAGVDDDHGRESEHRRLL